MTDKKHIEKLESRIASLEADNSEFHSWFRQTIPKVKELIGRVEKLEEEVGYLPDEDTITSNIKDLEERVEKLEEKLGEEE